MKTITDYDSDNNIIGKRNYHYKENMSSRVSSGILRYLPQNVIKYKIPLKKENIKNYISIVMSSTGGFYLNRTNNNFPDIAYSWIIEEFVDSCNMPLRYKRYHYTNYDEFSDEQPFFSTFDSNSPYFPHTSLSMKRGKILSEEVFDAEWRLHEKTVHSYSEVPDLRYILTGTQNNLLLSCCFQLQTQIVHNIYIPVGWLTKTYTYSYMPKSVKHYIYEKNGCFISDKTSYTYNSHKLCSTVSQSRLGDNYSNKTTEYKYTIPEDLNGEHPQYKWMADQHIFSPLETKTIINGIQKSTLLDYGVNENFIPYISGKKIRYKTNIIKTEFVVEKADPAGNPVQIRDKGIHKSIVWDEYGNKIIAIVENMTYDELEKTAKYVRDRDYLIEAVKSRIGVWAIIFTYDSSGKISEITKTNSNGEYFEYDDQGRLSDIYEYNLINDYFSHRKRFEYMYKNRPLPEYY